MDRFTYKKQTMKKWYFDNRMEELHYALYFLTDKGLPLTLKQADAVKKKLQFVMDNLLKEQEEQ